MRAARIASPTLSIRVFFEACAKPAVLALVVVSAACARSVAVESAPAPASQMATAPPFPCDPDNGGITLPAGFCAVVYADVDGVTRHLAVAANGDVFVALNNRRDEQGGVQVLRDTNGDGKADMSERWAVGGGSGIAIAHGHVYHAKNDAIVRYPVSGEMIPHGPPETIVSGLPVGGHASKGIAIRGEDLFVSIGSRTNACQQEDRTAESPGRDPCPELAERAGIWRFDAQRAGQTQSDGERWATGLRNPYAIAIDPADGQLYAISHGRDQLAQNWPALFTEEESARNPAEEMFRIERGADYGWPYCYYDTDLDRKVLAPEYGGDGERVGRCSEAADPIVAFPAHWAPNDLLFYSGTMFPASYRGGAFIAFHGSWNRAPLPQGGYNVTFVPAQTGGFAREHVVFADGFAGTEVQPRAADHRPTGLAQGPDGSLYISDDAAGRIWRVVRSR